MAYKILIVEDDEMLADAYRLKLEERKDIEMTLAKDGAEAIKLQKEFQPDMIILDLLMPNVDGYEVLETWKAEGLTDKVPVLVATNVSEFDSIQRAMQSGASDYFVKSDVVTDELVRKIDQLLEQKEQ